MPETEREIRLLRGLLLFVGSIYLVWWAAVHLLLPHAFNPFTSRVIVVLAIWSPAVASYQSRLIRSHLRLGWMGALWLITAHYYYLFYKNGADMNWVVGSFITVGAVSLGFLSRVSLGAYSIFAALLSIALVIMIPSLRQSVFLPGLVTVLLQANIGLHSRLVVINNLAASNERFQRLFNSTFEGILVHEAGRIVQVNDVLPRMLGFSRDELLGMTLPQIAHPDDREELNEKIKLDVMTAYHLKSLHKNGSALDVEIQGKPFTNDGRPSQLVTLQDISELRRSNEALERSNIDLQRFAYVASHDLQTPLRSIASFVDLLQATYETTLDEQGKDWLTRIGHAVKQLQTLIRDLLDYSRVDARNRPFENIALREIVDRATTLLETVVRESGAQITIDALPELKGDPSQLVQLMLNLLSNALKYRGSEAPRIHVTAENKGHEWRFGVRDNGIGIDSKHHQRVFEIFKRLHDVKEYPGTGIGLAVCRRVVTNHGGTIWVESEPGQGSTFYFTIAKSQEAAA